MGEIASADFELYPTRSEVGSVREFGMVFKDESGVFWNLVDTIPVSMLERVIQRSVFGQFSAQRQARFGHRASNRKRF